MPELTEAVGFVELAHRSPGRPMMMTAPSTY